MTGSTPLASRKATEYGEGTDSRTRAKLPERQQQLRSKLIACGLELIAQHGFDVITVTQIAEAAGTSRRTFFRYFDSKDDIVFDWLDEQGDYVMGQLLLDARATPPMQRLRDAMLALSRHLDENRKHAILMTSTVFDTPSLSGRYRAENTRWESEVVQVLKRGRPGDKDLDLRVQVAAASVTFFTALRAWAESNHDKPIEQWVRQAFRYLLSGQGKE